MQEFDWRKQRQIQVMGSDRVIRTVAMSPLEVIQSKGNRIQLEQVIASLCAATLELIRLHEESAERINNMYERMNSGDRDQSGRGESAGSPA
jgi:hypothetical protein